MSSADGCCALWCAAARERFGLTWVAGPNKNTEAQQLCNAVYCLFTRRYTINQTALRIVLSNSDLLDGKMTAS